MGEYYKRFIETLKQNKNTEIFQDNVTFKVTDQDKVDALKKALNLKTVREMTMTPQSRLQSFRRFVWKEMNINRKIDYNSYTYSTNSERVRYERFWGEANFLKGLEVEYENEHVKLNKEIFYLEDMSDEQILCYYTLVKEFEQNIIHRVNINYAKYYLLEVANMVYHTNPVEACQAMFEFWDALVETKKRTYDDPYFVTICDLFMIAHRDLIPVVMKYRIKRKMERLDVMVLQEIADGNYANAAKFVKKNARLLKEEEMTGAEDYITATWQAMPYVFKRLEKFCFDQGWIFDVMLLQGSYDSAPVTIMPMTGYATDDYTKRIISLYEFFEWNPYIRQWEKKIFRLDESVQDFLAIIHLYIESFFREYYLAKTKRKRSAARVINKEAAYASDHHKNVKAIKSILKNQQFEETIKSGIQDYISKEYVVLPKKPEKKTYSDKLYDMDHAVINQQIAGIDMDKLTKARKDAKEVEGLLHHGEIAYEPLIQQEEMQKEENQIVTSQNTMPKEEVNVAEMRQMELEDFFLFSDIECDYLKQLMLENSVGARKVCMEAKVPENIMIKEINTKALKIFSDVLIERENGEAYIIEDYMDELNKILG